MTTIESYTSYDKFAQWLKQGRPRRDGLPMLPKSVAVQSSDQPSKPRSNETPNNQRPLQAGRCASPNGQQAREFIEKSTARPTAKEVADKFRIDQSHAAALIRRKFGQLKRSDDKYNTIRAHIRECEGRPNLIDIVNQFHVSPKTARRLIRECREAVAK